MKISPNESCPCYSGKKYKKCCRPYHSGRSVPTPEALVRARYSAYALGLADFIMETTHPDNKDYEHNFDAWRPRIEGYTLRNQFNELEILSAEGNEVSYQANMMDFHIRPIIFTEESVFEQVDGEWMYLSGDAKTEEINLEEN